MARRLSYSRGQEISKGGVIVSCNDGSRICSAIRSHAAARLSTSKATVTNDRLPSCTARTPTYLVPSNDVSTDNVPPFGIGSVVAHDANSPFSNQLVLEAIQIFTDDRRKLDRLGALASACKTSIVKPPRPKLGLLIFHASGVIGSSVAGGDHSAKYIGPTSPASICRKP